MEIEQELKKYPPIMKRLLFNRGILNQKEAEEFLNPSYERDIYDPFLMLNLDKAVQRVYEAIKRDEKICIYADYDCDGIPGAVIWKDLFDKINFSNFQIYIPDRHKEGYGLNNDAIKEIADGGAKLLITLDLGITAVTEVEYAKDLNLEVIITDHHLPQEVLPKALVVVNPKQEGDTYPDEMLCGAGVAFKVIHGFIKKYGEEFGIKTGFEKWLLDMVGLATLADMVPLRKENRALAFYGLQVLKKTRREGLLKLFSQSKIELKNLNEDDITFSICPKLNAASRMDSPMRAFELLSSSSVFAHDRANHLNKINDERKIIVANIIKSIKKTFKLSERLQRDVIVVGDPTWRVGVLGLVASKIVEEYKKTAFVWGLEGGETIKGSCRSNGEINLVDLMSKLPEGTLSSFGGHSGAGGFSLEHNSIHFLEERLNIIYKDLPKQIFSEEKYSVDSLLDLSDINLDTVNQINKLAPFGVSNPKPVFLFKDVLIENIKMFGKNKEHIELLLKNDDGPRVKAICFFKNSESFNKKIKEGDSIDLIANIEMSYFGYKKEIRLRIIDIK